MSIIRVIFELLLWYLAIDAFCLALTLISCKERKMYWSCVVFKTDKGYVIANVFAAWAWWAGIAKYYDLAEYKEYKQRDDKSGDFRVRFRYFEVRQDGKFGVCNEWGKLIVPCEFWKITFTNGKILGLNGGKKWYSFRGEELE